MTRPRRPRGSLFWRVYLYGLAMLLLVGVAVGAVGLALRRDEGPPRVRIAAYAVSRIAEVAHTPELLDEELRRAGEAFGVDATVYDAAGHAIATNIEPPLALVSGGAPLGDGRVHLFGRRFGWAVPLPGGAGQLVVSGRMHGRDPARGLLLIGAVLVALALTSFPLARSIVAPVERITAAARALGEGDLSARSRVSLRGELGELGRAFDDMAERLERLVRSERELLANVSHELRTPLARIRVALELAAEGDLEKARRHLGEIGTDLSELDRLVEDVLQAARLDARGRWNAALEPVDAAALVGQAAERFRDAHPERTLEVVTAPGLSAVAGDAALLRRLLANLLDNAAKYSEAPAPVTLTARTTAGAVVLEVADRGIGIDPADLPHVFTPFFRTDRSRARFTGGSGLGLALAKRIADAHGATIAVESEPGSGTTIRVTLRVFDGG